MAWAHAAIGAFRRDGTWLRLTPGIRVALADVTALTLGSGYRVVPLSRPRGATLAAVRVARQPTNPHPGPSLRVELLHGRSLAVRIEPTR